MPITYEVLRDRNLIVQMGAGQTIDFNLPNSAVIDDPEKAPVVSLMFAAAAIYPNPGNLSNPQRWRVKLALEVNDRRISSYDFRLPEASVERALQEVMDPNTSRRRLNHGRNTLHLEIDGGQGHVVVQDIIIWYHTA